MNDIINEQISLVLEEIEMIGDNYQRADIRVKLITALTNCTVLPIENEPVGKDAFKNDTIKEVVEEPVVVSESKKDKKKKETKKSKKEKESQKVEVDEADEAPISFEPANQTEIENIAEETIEDPQPKEIDLEPEANEATEPIVIECEDEEGNAYTLDITEAWCVVGDEEGSEEKVELAKNLTEYNLLPIYNTLEKLDHSYNKMMLSYYMQEYGLDAINEFISDLTEGLFSDVYEFVNDENLEGLIANIESAAE